jgi:hypothetical protein
MIDAASHTTDRLRAGRVLRYAALVYAAGLLAHTADHLRRGLDVLTPEVLWAGNVSGIVAIVAIALAPSGFAWRRRSPSRTASPRRLV